jgi:hypothetical protein
MLPAIHGTILCNLLNKFGKWTITAFGGSGFATERPAAAAPSQRPTTVIPRQTWLLSARAFSAPPHPPNQVWPSKARAPAVARASGLDR